MFKLNTLVAAMSLALVSPMAAFASDTGDAPVSYGLATHEVVANGPYIGEIAGDDNAPINSPVANGDDNGATPDDEDGVFAFPVLVEFAKAYTTNVFVSNPSSQPATLVGWVDFDGDGMFSPDEAATETVPAGADNQRIKLLWPDTDGVTTGYVGPTFARFRISTDTIGAADAEGGFSDGEVEDYTLPILRDSDGDEIPDSSDPDNDNDGIPDVIEGTNIDTDGDTIPNYLDFDSDNDGIPDFAEAGPNVNIPIDTDADGLPDYLDLDSDNDGTQDGPGNAADMDSDGILDSIEGSIDSDGDGIINSMDIDSDNDLIPDSVEIGLSAPQPVDTDGDLIPDYLDLDSDNDGIPDIYESNQNVVDVPFLDADNNGAVDSGQVFGANGYADLAEKVADQGIPKFAVPDTDSDGVRDFRDIDSDNDGSNDVIEAGGADADNNGLVDAIVDTNQNGIPDSYDFVLVNGADANSNGIEDVADALVTAGTDTDGDNILDTFDLDVNGDGIVDSVVSDALNDLYRNDGVLTDLDDDNIPDFRDDDVVGGTTGGTTGGSEGTTGGTTGATTGTGGNTTAGGEPTNGTTGGSDGIVETGLSGSACSISARPGNDPLFPGLVLMGSIVLFFRRKLGVSADKR